MIPRASDKPHTPNQKPMLPEAASRAAAKPEPSAQAHARTDWIDEDEDKLEREREEGQEASQDDVAVTEGSPAFTGVAVQVAEAAAVAGSDAAPAAAGTVAAASAGVPPVLLAIGGIGLIAAASSSGGGDTPASPLATFDGKAIDGYLAGATVFVDVDGDGQLDADEPRATTDADGDFTLPRVAGEIVAFGGTDIATGLAFTGVLKAPSGATVVTPLTTLMAERMAEGEDAEAARAAVLSALGLGDLNVDLTTLDPVAAAAAGDADALALHKAGVAVAALVAQVTEQARGAAGGGEREDIAGEVYALLAGQLAANALQGGNLGVAGGELLDALGTQGSVGGVALDAGARDALGNARAFVVETLNGLAGRLAESEGLGDIGNAQKDAQGSTYRLQLLHFSDAEAGMLASRTAPNLAALLDAFEDDYANSITLAGGDNFIPGPFLAAGTDSSVRDAFNAVTGSSVGGTMNIAAVDIALHNAMGVEASALGNHDFDLGSNVLKTAITSTASYVGAQFPFISANLDFSRDTDLAGLYTDTTASAGLEQANALKGKIVPSAVLTENGAKIGLVGATTQILESISSPSGTVVRDNDGVRADDMDLLAAQLQPVIDDLISQGVNKIILMAHLQVIGNEKLLAGKLSGVDIILSAGSNTRLGDADDTAVAFPGHAATFADTYPLVIQDKDGHDTLIVNTDNEFTYLGRLVVDFDAHGHIVTESLAANAGINGAYAATDANVAAAWGVSEETLATTAFAEGTRGNAVKTLTDAVQDVITLKDGLVYGYSDVYLEGERIAVRNQETNLGDLSADANAHAAALALGAEAASTYIVSLKNGGGIRAQIGTISAPDPVDGTVDKLPPEGGVSQLDVENSLRFNNQLMVFDTTPEGLKAILEHGVASLGNQGRFPQVGGVAFSYDPDLPAGSRVGDIALTGEGYTVNLYDDGVKLDSAPATLSVVTLSFLANGGDSYPIKAHGSNFRYLIEQADGSHVLTAAVDEALNFTQAASVPGGLTPLGEQAAFANYMRDFHATAETAYNQADTPATEDERIQNLNVRGEDVLGAAAPQLLNASVDGLGDVITLYFDQPLDPAHPPAPEQFTVDNDGVQSVSRVQVVNNQVILTLAAPLDGAHPVQVSFTDPNLKLDDTNTVQSLAGTDAQGFQSVTVENWLSLAANLSETFTHATSLSLAGAEISAFDAASARLFVTAPAGVGLQVVQVNADLSMTLLGTVSLGGNDINSVAVKNGLVAVAVAAADKTQPGSVYFLDADASVADPAMVLGSVSVGALPDMLTFTPDGTKVLVANEGEQDTAGNNPEGSVSIIDLTAGVPAATVTTAGFGAFNDKLAELQAAGVRLFAGETGFETLTVAQDLEPEYIAISPDGTTAFVTLQENNAIGILDIATGEFTDIVPLGLKSFLGLPFDGSDRDGAGNSASINLQTDNPVFGQYMPDSIASFTGADGGTYFVIANEGDDRDDFITPDETARVSSLNLDDAAFPNAAALKTNAGIGRLTVSNAPGNNGDTDGDGDIDQILAYGGRSFSILNADGVIVFDSGSHTEQFVAAAGLYTGATGAGLFDDSRSDNKGSEPEGVTIGQVGGKTLAFVGLERGGGGVMVYDVTDPGNVEFVQYLRQLGDTSPEGLTFVDKAHSPTGRELLFVTNEVSNTVSLYSNQSLINGVASGDTTQDATVLWAHSTSLGNVTFEYGTDPDFATVLGSVSATVTDASLPVKVSVAGLSANTDYHYRVTDAGGDRETGSFHTAAALGEHAGLSFGVSGDWRGELSPYPAVANAAAADLDFFVLHGDTIYADFPSPDVPLDQASSLADYRAKQNEVYSARYGVDTLAELRASTSVLATIDDHEVTDDFAGGAAPASDPRFAGDPAVYINDTALYETGLQAFQEYNPIRNQVYDTPDDAVSNGEIQLYRYQNYGSDAAVMVLDARSFRDAQLVNADIADPSDVGRFLVESFTPDRTMLGETQLADLKADLLDAQAKDVTWKFVMLPEPIQNFGPLAAADRYEGYAAERAELLAFIETNGIRNVVFVSADIHGTVVNNLTYQAGPGQEQIATGAWEISTGAVAFDQPFGPTVVDLAQQAGLISGDMAAYYGSLPSDARNAFVHQLIDSQLAQFGYDPVGLDNNLASADGRIAANLLTGDWVAAETYGWTQFKIDPVTQELRVITYGVDPYDTADLNGANLGASINQTPRVVSEFTVTPELGGSEAVLAPILSFVAPDSSFDLANYSLTGRYALPVDPAAANKLAHESSAITYNKDTDTLFVVGDGGTAVVQVDKQGGLIDSMALATGSSPQGTYFYDTEGLAYIGEGRFVLVEERYRQLNEFTYAAGTTLGPTSEVRSVKLGTTIGNVGIEGLSHDPASGGYLLAKEATPQGIFQTTVDFATGTASNGSASTENAINLFDPALVGLSSFNDVFALSNLLPAGAAGYEHFLVLGAADGLVRMMDRAGNVLGTLNVGGTAKNEGVTMDAQGNIYVVGEEGGGSLDKPEMLVYAPTTGSGAVGLGSTLYITFASAVSAGTGSFVLDNGAGDSRVIAVDDATQVGISGATVSIDPVTDLVAGSTYTLTYAAGVLKDAAGDNIKAASGDMLRFSTVADVLAPSLTGTSPLDNATGVNSNHIVLTFSEAIQAGSGNIILSGSNAGGLTDVRTIAVGDVTQVTLDGMTVDINPGADLLNGYTYNVQIGAGVITDLAGNAFAGITSPTALNFTRGTGAVTSPRTLLISEVNSNAGPADFFELYNHGTETVDLSGWKWDDNSASFTDAASATFASGTTLGAGQRLVVAVGSDVAGFKSAWGLGDETQVVAVGGPGLGSGDAVVVFNNAGDAVTGFNYGGAAIVASDGSSIAVATASPGVTFAAGHAGAAFGGTATTSAVWDGVSLTSPAYTAAVVGVDGGLAQATTATNIGSPGAVPAFGAPGDLVFLAANADATDAFAFQLMKAVAAGTEIVFTDRNYSEATGMPSSGESAYVWTADVDYAAGTLVTIQPDATNPVADKGTVVGAGGGISTSAETLYAFTGAVDGLGSGTAGALTVNTFLAAINVGGAAAGDIPASLAGVPGAYVSFSQEDVFYSGLPWQGRADTASFLAGLENASQWNAGDSPAHQLIDGSLYGAPASLTPISAIQGAGSASAMLNSYVWVEAVVSAVTPGASGFYLQEETADSDGNDATSEGIFVYHGGNVPGITSANIGDTVRLYAQVAEYNGLTELKNLSNVQVVRDGDSVDVPAAVSLTLPVLDQALWEQYEGMLVEVRAASGELYVTDNYNLGRYGSVTLSSGGILEQFTENSAPDVAAYSAYSVATQANQIILDDGSSAQNPDPEIFARAGADLSAGNTLRAGDTTPVIRGVLDQFATGSEYSYETTYRVQATEDPLFSGAARPTAADLQTALGAAEIKVASVNVLNFFSTFGSADFTTPYGTSQSGRGADDAGEYQRQLDKLLDNLFGLDADVYGLMEIQNNGYGEGSALDALVDAMNARAGAEKYAYIAGPFDDGDGVDEPTAGDDAIMVALVYDATAVAPLGQAAVPDADVYDAFGATYGNRVPVAQTFQSLTDGETFTVAVNHLKSKGSVLDADIGDGQGANNLARMEGVTDLAAWLATNPTGAPDGDILLIGDLNAYSMEDPVAYLAANGYTKLNDGLSYSFDGLWGALDHALASASLASQVTRAVEWAINAEEPSVLDYNINYKSVGQIADFYAADEYRSSDHNPLLIGLNLSGGAADTQAPELQAATADGDTIRLGYDENLKPGNLPAAERFSVSVNGGDGPAVVSIAVRGGELSLTLASPLAFGDSIALGYADPAGDDVDAIQDIAGNDAAALVGQAVANHTPVLDSTAPSLVSSSPADDATGVAIGASLVLTFDEPMQKGTGAIVIRHAADGSMFESIDVASDQVSVSGTEVTLNPAANLALGNGYYVEMAAGVFTDAAGNDFAGIQGDTALNFSSQPGTPVFISELHYDNAGTDSNEAVGITGPAGTDLSGWSVVFYNGNGGAPYSTLALSGVIDDEGAGYGELAFNQPASPGIQNGAPDGLALVDAGGGLVQFLSYEGSFVGVGGAAQGLTSHDIGVFEAGTELAGLSLQLSGSGHVYEALSWNNPATASLGAINPGLIV